MTFVWRSHLHKQLGFNVAVPVLPFHGPRRQHMAAPSGTAYPGGGNPIGASMLFSHLAVLDMLGRSPD